MIPQYSTLIREFLAIATKQLALQLTNSPKGHLVIINRNLSIIMHPLTGMK